MAKGSGSLYRPNKGTSVWWMKYYRDGKCFRESTQTDNKRRAESWLKNRVAEVTTGAYDPENAKVTVDELVKTVIERNTLNGNKSVQDDRERWATHLQPYFGGLKAAHVTTTMLDRYIAQRKKEPITVIAKGPNGTKVRKVTSKFPQNGTINRELALLRRSFNVAYESTPPLVQKVPSFPMLKEMNIRKGFLADEQYDRLAAECSTFGVWLRAAFEMWVTYGWRRSEALENMRVRLVDFRNRCILIEDSKNGSGRKVFMTQRVFELLQACCANKSGDDYVFTRRNGKPIGDFRGAWKSATTKAGVPELHVHDLRRTGARNLRRLGISESVCMKITGHKTASVFKRYDIVDDGDLRDVAARLDEAHGHKTGITSTETDPVVKSATVN